MRILTQDGLSYIDTDNQDYTVYQEHDGITHKIYYSKGKYHKLLGAYGDINQVKLILSELLNHPDIYIMPEDMTSKYVGLLTKEELKLKSLKSKELCDLDLIRKIIIDFLEDYNLIANNSLRNDRISIYTCVNKSDNKHFLNISLYHPLLTLENSGFLFTLIIETRSGMKFYRVGDIVSPSTIDTIRSYLKRKLVTNKKQIF